MGTINKNAAPSTSHGLRRGNELQVICRRPTNGNNHVGCHCAQLPRDHGTGADALMVKFENYEPIKYTLKDGSVKESKDDCFGSIVLREVSVL